MAETNLAPMWHDGDDAVTEFDAEPPTKCDPIARLPMLEMRAVDMTAQL